MRATSSSSTSIRGTTPLSASSPTPRGYRIWRRGWRRPSRSSSEPVSTPPALVLFGALIASALAPLAVAMDEGSLGVEMRGHSAHVVSSRGTSSLGARPALDEAPGDSTRSPSPGTTPLAADTSATPGAAITCQAQPPATPSPTPAGDTSSFLGPTPTPAPDPDAVGDSRLDAMAATAAAALEACWN